MQRRQAGQLERPYNWRKVEKPGSRRVGLKILLFLLVLVIIALIGVVLYGEYEIHAPQNANAAPFGFAVRAGDSSTTVADRLQQRGVLHNTLLFRLDAKLRGLGGHLRVGTYTLKPNMSIDQMVSTLATSHVRLVSITIPEGWRAGQIAARLEANGISGSQFLNAVRHPRLSLSFPAGIPRNHGIDGFLFPDTYLIDPKTSGSAFAQLMVHRFEQKFGPGLRAQARRQHRSVFHIVIMASIVEREDKIPSQKKLIASVYYNRLRSGMYLQSDPTVQYGLGRPGDWWPVLSVADYHSVKSPYNTYLHPGFPPGAIADPGIGSLRAAVYPAHTGYYYFSGKGNTGYLLFAKTLQQQQANIRKYG